MPDPIKYSNYSVDEIKRYLKMYEKGEISAPILCIHISCYLDRYMGKILNEHDILAGRICDDSQTS